MSKEQEWLTRYKALEDYVRDSDENNDSEPSESELLKLKELRDSVRDSMFDRMLELRSGGD